MKSMAKISLKEVLVALVRRAYKEGYNDSANKCEADDSFLEKLVDELLFAEE